MPQQVNFEQLKEMATVTIASLAETGLSDENIIKILLMSVSAAYSMCNDPDTQDCADRAMKVIMATGRIPVTHPDLGSKVH